MLHLMILAWILSKLLAPFWVWILWWGLMIKKICNTTA